MPVVNMQGQPLPDIYVPMNYRRPLRQPVVVQTRHGRKHGVIWGRPYTEQPKYDVRVDGKIEQFTEADIYDA